VDIQLDPSDRQRLEDLARESGKPPSELLRELVSSALRTSRTNGTPSTRDGIEESFLQAAERAGAVGCVEGGPADMSTNPKYLGGFGVS
jgi:hypothetical protein